MNLSDYVLRALAHRARIRAAVGSAFEVTADPAERVRRLDVVNHVAKELGVRVVVRSFMNEVRAVVEDMGAEAIKPRNARWFRKLRRRATGG